MPAAVTALCLGLEMCKRTVCGRLRLLGTTVEETGVNTSDGRRGEIKAVIGWSRGALGGPRSGGPFRLQGPLTISLKRFPFAVVHNVHGDGGLREVGNQAKGCE